MESTLSNSASATVNYNSIPTTITSVAAIVTMLSGLTITKTADKTVWADGNLTYTITVDNQTSLSYASPVITDTLDISLVNFVDGSLTIDGTSATSSEYTYAEDTGVLTINLSDIAASTTKTITFQVSKKA